MAVNIPINSTFQNTENSFHVPEPLRITFTALGVLYTIIGLPGNILTIVAIVKVNALRSGLNLFLVNLCIADILAVGYLYPFVTFDLILGHHPVPLLWCQINLIIMNLTVPASYITILLIALSRYIKILHGPHFERHFSTAKIAAYCVMTWTPGIFLGLFNITNLSAIQYTRRSRMCFVQSGKFKLAKWLAPPIILVSYVCVIYCYWRIGRALNAYALSIRSHGNEAFSKMRLDANRRLTSMSFLIFLFYICMTIPLLLMLSTGWKVASWVHISALSLSFGNSAVNCIVYGAMHKPIRRYYKSLVPKVWFVRVQPAPIRR